MRKYKKLSHLDIINNITMGQISEEKVPSIVIPIIKNVGFCHECIVESICSKPCLDGIKYSKEYLENI